MLFFYQILIWFILSNCFWLITQVLLSNWNHKCYWLADNKSTTDCLIVNRSASYKLTTQVLQTAWKHKFYWLPDNMCYWLPDNTSYWLPDNGSATDCHITQELLNGWWYKCYWTADIINANSLHRNGSATEWMITSVLPLHDNTSASDCLITQVLLNGW